MLSPIPYSGDQMTEHPLKIYEKLDPELLRHVENSGEFVFNDGVRTGAEGSI